MLQRSVANWPTARSLPSKEQNMFETIFLAGLLVSVPASLPVWPYSRHWGFKLSAALGILLVALLILAVADPNF
jgi:hypothetical protein